MKQNLRVWTIMDESLIREQFCQAVRQLWTRGMLVGADGLLSCEVHRRRYLVTPIGRRRVDLEPGDLTCVDIGGENVHGGEGIPLKLWQPHRDVYQSHSGPDAEVLSASALIEPANVLALLSKQNGSDRLDLGGGQTIPLVDRENDGAMREALSNTTEAVLQSHESGTGLFIAAPDLATMLNRIERIDLLAAVRLAAGG